MRIEKYFQENKAKPTGVPLVMQNVTVTWNHDKGHQLGLDKTLLLPQAVLDSTVLWGGGKAGPILTITTAANGAKVSEMRYKPSPFVTLGRFARET